MDATDVLLTRVTPGSSVTQKLRIFSLQIKLIEALRCVILVLDCPNQRQICDIM